MGWLGTVWQAWHELRPASQLGSLLLLCMSYVFPLGGLVVFAVLQLLGRGGVWRIAALAGALLAMAFYVFGFFI